MHWYLISMIWLHIRSFIDAEVGKVRDFYIHPWKNQTQETIFDELFIQWNNWTGASITKIRYEGMAK